MHRERWNLVGMPNLMIKTVKRKPNRLTCQARSLTSSAENNYLLEDLGIGYKRVKKETQGSGVSASTLFLNKKDMWTPADPSLGVDQGQARNGS